MDIKENEIVAAPKVVGTSAIGRENRHGRCDAHPTGAFLRKLSSVVATICGRSRKTRNACTKIFSACLPLTSPNLDLAKSRPTFNAPKPSMSDMDGSKPAPSKPVPCSMITWIGLGCGQVYRLERKFTWMRQGKAYKTSCEVEFGITSLSREKASPDKLLAIRRQHWLIETGLHYRRDVTFHEDATRMTIGAAGRILAIVHNLVLGLLKKAGFHQCCSRPDVGLEWTYSGGFWLADLRSPSGIILSCLTLS